MDDSRQENYLVRRGAVEALNLAGETVLEFWYFFDGVIDFDKVMRDPKNQRRYLPQYDHGDHLHPNDAGYKAMSDAIDLKIFQ
ncbi:MAG: SGNH/GDSL hydrolase family protein [Acidobacteriaceae bacterium]